MSERPGERPPSVDALARSLSAHGLPHPLLVDVARAAIGAGEVSSAPERAEDKARSLLGPVINATGVLLHTNLGRAPQDPATSPGPAGGRTGFRYSNLEMDMSSGRRGSRRAHAGDLLARASGAEAALVVNNGAAAVLLVLTCLGQGRQVVVSRGELVEIGGGFRIPDVLAASGAELVEVGTTNRTRLSDYAGALGPEVALVLKVHQSNYKMVGFTASTSVKELAGLGTLVVADLGSGLLDARVPWMEGPPPAWLADEPAVRQSLEAGTDLVTFSGDKLLGGPQAGIIAGRADLVERCATHPLYRALRPGGLVLRALQDVALAYLRADGAAIPFWRMAGASLDELDARAQALGVGTVVHCTSMAGGGSVPGLGIPSIGVAMEGDLTAVLRLGRPPVMARIEGGRTILDMRSVDPVDDEALAKALRRAGA